MPAHRVRERAFEQIVVFRGELFDDSRQTRHLRVGQIVNAFVVVPRNEQRFEWPSGPIRHHNEPVDILNHDSFAFFQFPFDVIAQHWPTVFLIIFLQMELFDARFIRQERTRPDLTVRMGIGTSHCCAFILEYLHPRVLLAQLYKLCNPSDVCEWK